MKDSNPGTGQAGKKKAQPAQTDFQYAGENFVGMQNKT